MTGSCLVAEARNWIGTPYEHQASCRGAGADCLGLLRGVIRVVTGNEPERVPAYTPDWSETDGQERLLMAAKRHFVPVKGDWEPGDVLVFRMRKGAVAKHLAIFARDLRENPTMIHAYSRLGVVETGLSAPWMRRVAGVFRMIEEAV